MEEYKVEFRTHICKKCSYFYTTTNAGFNMDLYYGTIFFFTAAKEIAAIVGKDTKLQEFAEIIEKYARKKHIQVFITRIIHTAWAHFADKSQKGYPFHIWGMSSVCPNCGNDDMWQIDMVLTEEEIEAQPILYTQWDLHSYKEKKKILHAFFDEYLDNNRKKYE